MHERLRDKVERLVRVYGRAAWRWCTRPHFLLWLCASIAYITACKLMPVFGTEWRSSVAMVFYMAGFLFAAWSGRAEGRALERRKIELYETSSCSSCSCVVFKLYGQLACKHCGLVLKSAPHPIAQVCE